MFASQPILIVEDECLIAGSLADVIEALDGEVIGPFDTVERTLQSHDCAQVAGAILDVCLLDGDIMPVLERLSITQVPFVIHSATGLPDDGQSRRWSHVVSISKPAAPSAVAALLLAEISKRARQAPPADRRP